MANNEDIVKTLAKMVDERLTVEFEKRDKAILDLKKGMDTLVQSLRENGNNNMKRLKSGSQSARGSPRPALAGRRLSPRPPGAQTARSHTDGKMLLLPYKPGEFGRSPITEVPWGARPRRSKKSKKAVVKRNKKIFGSQAHPVRDQYKLLPDVNFGYAERDGYGRLEYYPRKKGGVPRVGMIYKDRRMEACKQRAQEYMSADRKYDKLSIEKEDYPECRSTIFRPQNYDESKIDLSAPPSKLELEFVYGYSGWCPTVGGDTHGDQNIFYLKNGEIIYPASAVVVLYNKDTHTQRFYRDHYDDLSGMCVHPNGVIIASGQVGHYPPIMLWDSGAGTWEGTSENAQLEFGPPPWPPETIGILNYKETNVRSWRAMDFSSDGKLLMTAGCDDGHTIVIWHWEAGEILATAKGHGSTVITAGFCPYQARSILESEMDADAHYTLVSCGTKHIKFWTLSLVPDPEFKVSGGGSMDPKKGMGDETNSKLPGKKALDLVKKVPKQGLGGEIKNLRDELMKWHLEGDTGKFGKAKIEDIMCITWIPTLNLEGYNEDYELDVLTVVGSAGGHVMVWKQNVIPPDSESDSEDDEEDAHRAQLTWWECKGSLICLEKNVHPGGVLGVEWVDSLQSPSRLVTTGSDCTIKLFEVKVISERKVEFIKLSELNQSEAHFDGWKPRSIADGGEFAANKLIAGTTGNDILEIEVSDDGSSLAVTTHKENRPMLPAHSGTLMGLATHPFLSRFATASEDKSVAIWDYDERFMVFDTKLPSKAQVAAYSSDGKMLAIGMTESDFVVFTGGDSEDGKLIKVCYKKAVIPTSKAPKPRSRKKDSKLSKKMEANAEAADNKKGKQKLFKVNEEVSDIKFAPDDSLLAVGSRDNNIYIYDVKKNFRLVGICKGHSSYITHIDWSQEKWMLKPGGDDSNFNKFCIQRNGVPAGHSSYIIQSDAGDYEHLFWWHSPPNYRHNGRWEQFRDTADMCDTEWHTWTCTLGFPVMGIWPEYSDGTDVNTVDRSKSRNLVVTGEDTFEVRLFRFPCLRVGEWGADNRKNAKGKSSKGHMSHVMQVRFSKRDEVVLSAGGIDCCIFQWRHIDEETGEAAVALEDQYEDVEKDSKPNVMVEDVPNPDDTLDDTIKTLDDVEQEQTVQNSDNAEVQNENAEEQNEGEVERDQNEV